MTKIKLLTLILIPLILILIFAKPLTIHLKTLLFISEQFPQIPAKPLGLITSPPTHEQIQLSSPNGPLNADLYLPASPATRFDSARRERGEPASPLAHQPQYPALIISMGVKTEEKDRPAIRNFAQSLARLGFIVIWPRRQQLDQGLTQPEDPQTFVTTFKYLEKHPQVANNRISLVGFSVGSSIAMVAASDPSINNQVHSLVFFGGYFDIFDYLKTTSTQTITIDGQKIAWAPHESAMGHIRDILRSSPALSKVLDAKTGEEVDKILTELPQEDRGNLEKLNPRNHLAQFRSPVFILHDRADPFVPYDESIKLSRALPPQSVRAHLILELFEHVKPQSSFSPKIAQELAKLYGFLYQTLDFL